MRFFVCRGKQGTVVVADFGTQQEADDFAAKCSGYYVVPCPFVKKNY